jgi:hypothetical protein
MWHVWGRREMHIGFGLDNMKERDSLEGLGMDGQMILKLISKEIGWKGMP